MAYTGRFGQSDDYRREELIKIIEHSVENLTLQELEALYNDLTKIYMDIKRYFIKKKTRIIIVFLNHIIYRSINTMIIRGILDIE